jgi:ABC-type spermidine/putrescine transport systems, ATPase components
MYLETKSLTKVFGKQTAVDNLDLAIEKGSFTAILGPNGAGKSTTIEMLLGALSPTSGSIYYQTKSRNSE